MNSVSSSPSGRSRPLMLATVSVGRKPNASAFEPRSTDVIRMPMDLTPKFGSSPARISLRSGSSSPGRALPSRSMTSQWARLRIVVLSVCQVRCAG